MGHLFVRYGDKWAIWSTVVEDFIFYDATAQEVIEYEAQRAYERKQKKSERMVELIEAGGNPYPVWTGPPQDKLEEIKNE